MCDEEHVCFAWTMDAVQRYLIAEEGFVNLQNKSATMLLIIQRQR